jgi:hypothetical protein
MFSFGNFAAISLDSGDFVPPNFVSVVAIIFFLLGEEWPVVDWIKRERSKAGGIAHTRAPVTMRPERGVR